MGGMKWMWAQHARRARRAAAGQSYALVVGLIAILAVAATTSIGENVRALFGGLGARMAGQITAGNDSATTRANDPVLIDVLANDGGSGLRILSVTSPADGTATEQDNQILYTPSTDFTGTDSFSYTAVDSSGVEAEATVTVTVRLHLVDDAVDTPADTPVDLAPLANDLGNVQLLSVDTTSANGATIAEAGGTVTYTPPFVVDGTGFSGADSLTYRAQDPITGVEGTGRITVTVQPVAVDDDLQVAGASSSPAAQPLDVLANDIGLGLTVTAAGQTIAPSLGSVQIAADGLSVLYTPNAGVSGSDSFSYGLSGAGGQDIQGVATVGIQPALTPDTAGTQVGQSVTIDVLANDGGSTLTVTAVTDGAGGSVVDNGDGTVTYTPTAAPAAFLATDSFTYTATGDGGVSGTGDVTVTIAPVLQVSTLADGVEDYTDTDLTLREAVAFANADIAGDAVDTYSIGFINGTDGGSITLTLGQIHVTQSMTLANSGAMTLDAGSLSRHFVVQNGATFTLADWTLQNGEAFADGGGSTVVSNTGSALVLTDVDFINNQSGSSGGAIRLQNDPAGATISGGSFTGGQTDTNGGAIGVVGSGLVQISGGTEFGGANSGEPNQAPNGRGGAVYVSGAGQLTIDGATFTANTAALGGAITLQAGATALIRDADFASNVSGGGGAIQASSLGTSLSIVGGSFTNNRSNDNSGGAIRTDGEAGPLWIAGTDFCGNFSQTNGGAVGVVVPGSSNLSGIDTRIVGATFNDQCGANESQALGGAVFQQGGALTIGGDVTIDGTVHSGSSSFESNRTQLSDSRGGAIYQQAGSLTVLGGTFHENYSVRGGAIFHQGGLLTLRNATFSENQAGNAPFNPAGFGGALYAAGTGAASQIEDTGFIDNIASTGGAIYLDNTDTLLIRDSSFSGNEALLGQGGAILNQGAGTLSIEGTDDGDGDATLFQENRVNNQDPNQSEGGAIALFDAQGAPWPSLIVGSTTPGAPAVRFAGNLANYGNELGNGAAISAYSIASTQAGFAITLNAAVFTDNEVGKPNGGVICYASTETSFSNPAGASVSVDSTGCRD